MHFFLSILAFAFVLLPTDTVSGSESGVGILKYDKDGRAIGVQSRKTKKVAPKSTRSTRPKTFDARQDYDKSEVLILNPPKSMGPKAAQKGFVITEITRLDALGLSMARVAVPSGKSVKVTVRGLKRSFSGMTVVPNHYFQTASAQTAAVSLRTHARAAMRWKAVPDSCGRGLRMGLVDTGVDTTHPAFRKEAIIAKSFVRRGKQSAMGDHGTSVASMLVGNTQWGGLLPGAKVHAANIFERLPDGRVVSNAANLAQAIDWLLANKVKVVNLSITGADNPLVKQILSRATKKGMIFVAAAGNWGERARPAYPAAYKDVIAVTALGTNLKPYDYANRGSYIDFAAPGVRIWAAVPGGGRFRTGTSFATPYITAVAAMDAAKGRIKTANDLRGILRKRIKDLGKTGKDDTFGWGVPLRPPSCR